MGLDMYLSAKRFLWSFGEHSDVKLAEQIAALFPELTPKKAYGKEVSRVKEVSVEAIYWRKSNAIHAWFVKNCQGGVDDCGNYRVEREELQELADLCKEVLADHSKAAELPPAKDGFFFGSTDFDEWYFEDLERTVQEIEQVLTMPDAWEFEYHSSW